MALLCILPVVIPLLRLVIVEWAFRGIGYVGDFVADQFRWLLRSVTRRPFNAIERAFGVDDDTLEADRRERLRTARGI